MADYYKTNVIPPPAGAVQVRDPKELSTLTEQQIWRQPGTTAIFKLQPQTLPPLQMQPGEQTAMENVYTTGGYSAEEAKNRVADLTKTRPPAPAGVTPPQSLNFAPTGQNIPTTPQQPAAGPAEAAGGMQPAGSMQAFQGAMGGLLQHYKSLGPLQDQKRMLLKQLYDQPLTPEELRTLSPEQQRAIREGNKDLVEYQIMTLNDQIKGRGTEMDKAVEYAMKGYEADQAALEKRRADSFTTINNLLEKYPQLYSELSEESMTNLMNGQMPTQADLIKIGKMAKTLKPTSSAQPTAAIQEYEYYAAQETAAGRKPISFDAYQTQDANRKAAINKLNNSGLDYQTQTQVDALARGFDNSPIVKDFVVVQDKKATIDRILAGDQSGPGDVALVYEFMKALDPASVVRESEYAAAAKSGNIFIGALAQFNGLFKESGGKLSGPVKESFKKVIEAKYGVKAQQYDNLYNETGRKINRKTGKTDGTEYLTNYKQAVPETQPLTAEQQKAFDTLKKTNPDMSDEEIRQALGFNNEGSGSGNALTTVKVGARSVKVASAIATPLERADSEFFAATGKHIIINESVRSHERQVKLYADYKAGKGGRAAPPGKSYHETGKAIDVQNWKEAEPYLRRNGFKNNLSDDKNHFSIGEFA